MNYLKKIYLNWFTLGLTIGLIPYVFTLILNNNKIILSSFAYIFCLLIPTLVLIISRRIKFKNARKII
ncbi:hypothetical protein SAMN00017477_0908 [Peptoniphilus asaccharolyticus DSM 20463]|uniref:Uncharacterized protein n=1 Tax=Peptoniphilus asaccharolyticus DSM 20463 TaxID=573058 RepID=A0A1W1UZL7_PEPAS|nr:hypothetical protein SAMN00017477_0908 [Peptoniphilus asaccharolyticus DSM 20463]